MATDYDTPRKTDEELQEESLEELKAKRAQEQSGQIDIDEAEAAENLELPGADLSGEEFYLWRRKIWCKLTWRIIDKFHPLKWKIKD